MRIAHVEAGRHLYGGAAQVDYLLQGLTGRGVENVLLCPKDSELAAATSAALVRPLPMRGELDAALLPRLARELKRLKPDLVHVHSRRGADLYMEMPVTMGETMLGATIEVPTVDGAVRVKVPPRSQAGRQLRVRGRGAPQLRGKERGDLYLKLVVHVPETDAPAAAEAARTLDGFYARNPRDGWRL